MRRARRETDVSGLLVHYRAQCRHAASKDGGASPLIFSHILVHAAASYTGRGGFEDDTVLDVFVANWLLLGLCCTGYYPVGIVYLKKTRMQCH